MPLIKNEGAVVAHAQTQTPVQVPPAHIEQAPVQQTVVQEVPVQQTVVQEVPVQQTVVQEVPVQQTVVQEVPVQQTVQTEVPVQQTVQTEVPVQQAMQPANAQGQGQAMASPVAGGSLAALADQGFEGLAFDWTSFPSISLKNEGHFEDFDGKVYGKELTFYVRGSKKRTVYRAEPYADPKKDVMFTYDNITTQNGVDVQAELARWKALGKTTKPKEYLEVMVELFAPGTEMDGEFRILSIPPASTGRLSGHLAKATFKGNGNPGAVLTVARVGNKVTGVANPFYPWDFKITTEEAAAAAA